MNLAAVKKKLKQYTPEIIVATTVVAGVAAAIHYYKSIPDAKTIKDIADTGSAPLLELPITAEDICLMNCENTALRITTPTLGVFTITHDPLA